MDELNPNHPVTQKVHEEWHKFAAILMMKLGVTKVTITMADLHALERSNRRNIVCHMHRETIDLLMVDANEARELVRKEGGLPV